MKTFAVKMTWVKAEDRKNAVCAGLDETRVFQFEGKAEDAVRKAEADAAEEHQDEIERGHVPDGELITWCVCRRETSDDGWETEESGLDSLESAEAWMRAHYAEFPAVAWYVDRENNDGMAASYWDVRDGKLAWTN